MHQILFIFWRRREIYVWRIYVSTSSSSSIIPSHSLHGLAASPSPSLNKKELEKENRETWAVGGGGQWWWGKRCLISLCCCLRIFGGQWSGRHGGETGSGDGRLAGWRWEEEEGIIMSCKCIANTWYFQLAHLMPSFMPSPRHSCLFGLFLCSFSRKL